MFRSGASMSIQVFKHIRDAIGNLNPEAIQKHTERPLRLFLYADSEGQYRQMEDFFIPRDVSEASAFRFATRCTVPRRASSQPPPETWRSISTTSPELRGRCRCVCLFSRRA